MTTLFHKDGLFALHRNTDRRDPTARYIAEGWDAYEIAQAGLNLVLRKQRIKAGTAQYIQVLSAIELEQD